VTPAQKRRAKRRKHLRRKAPKEIPRTIVRFNPRTNTVVCELNPNRPDLKL